MKASTDPHLHVLIVHCTILAVHLFEDLIRLIDIMVVATLAVVCRPSSPPLY